MSQTEPKPGQKESIGKWKPGDIMDNHYEVYHVFTGGFGVVYICYNNKAQEPVAIKGFKEEYALDETIIKLFEREALEWTELEKHQNIVKCKYVSIIEERPYIFLEYVSGKENVGPSLRHWLASGEIDPKDTKKILSLAIHIANGMSYAFEKRGLIHRDLNPNNVLITSDGVAKVTDFGLAKAIGTVGVGVFGSSIKEGSASILEGNICGTPPYMPPEQWLGIDKTDTRSDIYSFGCILYEMLSGSPPFGYGGNLKQAHFNQSPISLQYANAWVSGELDNLTLKCLMKNPNDRYPTFKSLRDGLARIYEKHFNEKLTLELKGEELEAWELSNKGMSLANLGHYNEAINHYNQALKLDPRFANVFNNRGVAYKILGNHEQAINDYSQTIKLDSRHTVAYNNRGIVYYDLGDYMQAINDYTQAIKLNPSYAEAYNNRGLAHIYLGNHEQAVKDCDQALKLDPKYANAYNNRGVAYLNLGSYDEAIKDCNRALKLDLRYVLAYFNRGLAYYNLGNHEQAIRDYQKFIELAPPHYGLQIEQAREKIRQLENR